MGKKSLCEKVKVSANTAVSSLILKPSQENGQVKASCPTELFTTDSFPSSRKDCRV